MEIEAKIILTVLVFGLFVCFGLLIYDGRRQEERKKKKKPKVHWFDASLAGLPRRFWLGEKWGISGSVQLVEGDFDLVEHRILTRKDLQKWQKALAISLRDLGTSTIIRGEDLTKGGLI